jgi:hypothetical protein
MRIKKRKETAKFKLAKQTTKALKYKTPIFDSNSWEIRTLSHDHCRNIYSSDVDN